MVGIIILFFSACKKDEEDEDSLLTTQIGTVSDNNGNTYNTVTIGEQVWMDSNLKTTKYNDGTAIHLVTNVTLWNILTTPAYCWYNNDAATYKNTYGAIYNWYTINTGKLCPTGWHVPSDGEWSTLIDILGGGSVAGGKLKESGTNHWLSPNSAATNSSGFTALPGGYQYAYGSFDDIGVSGNWWSSTEDSNWSAWSWNVSYNNSGVLRVNYSKNCGFSVRCLRDKKS